MTAKKIALFIDADNISAKFGKQIIETLERRGEIFIRRIYGNWEKFSLHGWNDCILNFSLRAVQQPDFVSGKNATDMSLTIDAMDVLYGGKAEIFAIVSNDSDFTPLAIRLREGGVNVIGIGNSHATNSFRSACNEFIDLNEQIEISVPVAPKKTLSPAQEKIQPVQLSLFDDEKISPPPVVPAPNPKVVSIADRKVQSDQDKKLQQIHNVLKETAKIYGDENGFVNLGQAGNIIIKKNLDIKISGHSKLGKLLSAFSNLYEVKENSYRCK